MKATPVRNFQLLFVILGGWLTFCLAMFVLGLLLPAPARADAGPFPTLTPTPTATFIPTLTPTFLPTWTPVPTTDIVVQVTPPFVQATVIPTEIPQRGGGLGGLICLPLGLGLFLVAVIVTLLLFGRGRFT